jgi:lysyl-tRNA synthetase class 2
MPEKHKGLADIEIKYRQRYLDLMSSPESKEIFIKRSQIVSSIRASMIEDGFLEGRNSYDAFHTWWSCS